MSRVRFELYSPKSGGAKDYWCDGVDEIIVALEKLNKWSACDDVVLISASRDDSSSSCAVINLSDIDSFVEVWGKVRCPVFYNLTFSSCLADHKIDYESLDSELFDFPDELIERIAGPLLVGWRENETTRPIDVPLGIELFFPWEGVLVSYLLVSGYFMTPGMYLNHLNECGEITRKIESHIDDFNREEDERLDNAKEKLREFLLNDPEFERCTNKELRREYVWGHVDDPLFLDVYSDDSPSDPNRVLSIHIALADLTSFYQTEIRPRLKRGK